VVDELDDEGGVERALERERVMILSRVGEAGRGDEGEGEGSGDGDGDVRSMQSCRVEGVGSAILVTGMMKNRNQGVDSTPP